jgi:hypothetical protein
VLWILLTGVIGALACGLLILWDTRRTTWESTLRRQLWELADQSCLERLPDWACEALARGR